MKPAAELVKDARTFFVRYVGCSYMVSTKEVVTLVHDLGEALDRLVKLHTNRPNLIEQESVIACAIELRKVWRREVADGHAGVRLADAVDALERAIKENEEASR